jgi:RHS repeat-associated protein
VGNLTSYTDGFGTTVSARYDAAGRLSNVSTAGNGTTPTGTLWTANTYGAVGLTQATYGSSQAVENLQYTKRMALQSSSTVNASNATLYSEGITYYPNLNMKTATDLVNGKWSYTYDTLNRLSTAAVTSGTANAGESCQFGYDAFGNRTSEAAPQGSSCFNATPFTFTKTATNRVDGYCYDGAGNLLDTQACPAAGSHDQYYYDGFGNMLSPNYNSAGATSYTVDALGQRIAKWSGGTMTNQYLYGADGQAVAEMDGSGNWLRTNVRVGGQFLAELQGTKTYYRLNDHLGTVRAEFGSDGCLSTYTSLPFGDGQTTVANGCADITLHHFTGKERDTESGNDYFGARYYASSMARWISPDEVNMTEERMLNPSSTLNKYAYAANNPLTYVDPDGQDITIFFENGIPGHTMMLAFDPSLPRAAYRSFGPDHGSPGWWLAAISIPVPGTDQFGFDQLKTADAIRQKFAIITLKTSPETTQKVVQELLTHPDGKYITLGTNCTTSCLKVIAKIKGLTPGNNPLIPYDYFSQLYLTNGNGTAANRNNGPVFQPGNNYGRYTPGWDPFSILDRLINSQKPPGDDANGPHPAYPCNGCPKFD